MRRWGSHNTSRPALGGLQGLSHTSAGPKPASYPPPTTSKDVHPCLPLSPSPAVADTFYKQVSLPAPQQGVSRGCPGSQGAEGRSTGPAGLLPLCLSGFCLYSPGGTIRKDPCCLEAEGSIFCAPTWLGRGGTPR